MTVGHVLWGLFRDMNTRNKRLLRCFGTYCGYYNRQWYSGYFVHDNKIAEIAFSKSENVSKW